MNLDWSEAPEGAEAGHPGGEGLYPVWFRKDVAGLVEQICPAAGINTWTWMGGRKDFPVGSVLRPPILLAHHDQISASSAGFELITAHEGLINSIKNFCSTGKNIEAFGYLFGVIEFHHHHGGAGSARLRQVNVPSMPAWNGEGLPPVGTVCEFDGFNPEETLPTDPRVGDQVTVIAHFMSGSFELAAFTFHAPPEFKYLRVAQGAYGCFRPIRTPEQIAAEERLQKAIELYGAVMNHSGQQFKSLPAERQEHYLSLIDAGWQKVPRA